jgi:hypothetical protein
MRVIN